jgi:hypothetical protein
MHKNKNDNKRYLIAVSEISFAFFLVLVLFLIKQLIIIYSCKSNICRIYSSVYYCLIIVIPVLCTASIIIDIINGFSTRKGFSSIVYGQAFLFGIINIFIGALILLAIINTTIMLLIQPVQNDKPREMTILYDPGSLNGMLVCELATPLALEMIKNNIRVSVLPIDEDNIKMTFRISEYVVVLSHGDDGKVYTTKPLKPYENYHFKKLDKGILKLVYFSACNLGINGYDSKWENAMRPAKVILYNRESAVIEHIIWLLFKAKSTIIDVDS